MSKPFRLGEEVGPHPVGSDEPAGVSSVVDEIKEGEDLGEVGTEHEAARVTGAGVEHVDNAKGQEDMGLVRGVREVAVDKEMEKVGDGVKAAINANAKLASRKEEGSKVRAEVGKEDGSRETMLSSADAKQMEFVGISGVLVEGQEVVGMEEGSSRFRDGASVDEGKDINERGEVGAVTRGRAIRGVLRRLVSGKGMKKVNGVSEGASSSAMMGMGKDAEDKGGLEGESRGVGVGG